MAARNYDAIAERLGSAGDPAADIPPLPPLELQDLKTFATQPKARWLVRGILPPDSLVVVFGLPKGGKTFSTTDMLMHAAHGMDWYGHAVPRPLRVAFLAGEGRNGLRVRLHAWMQHHDTADLSGAFEVLPTSFALPDRVEELIELLRPFKPDVIVPDTLNAFFGVGDENSTQDMTRFVAALRRLREALSCSVVVLHHTALADAARERGSGVLRGAADVVIQVGKAWGSRSSPAGISNPWSSRSRCAWRRPRPIGWMRTARP
jgi:RecA-family ATPase